MREISFSSLDDIEPGYCVRLKVSHAIAGSGLCKVEDVVADGVVISHGGNEATVPFNEIEAVFAPDDDIV